MDKYREYLPQSWLEFIDRDPVLAAAFSARSSPIANAGFIPAMEITMAADKRMDSARLQCRFISDTSFKSFSR